MTEIPPARRILGSLPRDFRGVLTIWLIGAWTLLMSRAPADPDLWGHLRFGRDLLAAGRLTTVDPYSFTSDRPWINHEWLSEALMAAAFNGAGAAGLNLLRFAVIGLVLLLVWRTSRSVAPRYRSILVALAAVGITLRALPVRPQLFSLLCFALMLAVLVRTESEGHRRSLLWLPPIFAFWVNVHGGWIVGLGTLALWTVFSLGRRARAPWALPAAATASALATLINPYGVHMWTFIYSTVGFDRPMIGDWMPIYALPPGFWLGWLVGAGLCVAGWRCRARIPSRHLAIAAILGLAAIRVSRIDAFFCLAAVFLLAPVFPTRGTTVAPAASAPRAMAVVGALSAVAVAIATVMRLPHIEIRPQLMPEAAAVDYVVQQRLVGRFLTWFDWGEFAIWHLADQHVRVSMDGRRETVYSDRVVSDHLRFYAATIDPGAYARGIAADYAWLPRDMPAVRHLIDSGWTPAFSGPISVILRAPGRAPTPPMVVSRSGPRDFPGP
jgi:hypothetical protein